MTTLTIAPSSLPTAADHERAWHELAGAIAARRDSITDQPDGTAPSVRGELTIIGSGIESISFTLGDEELLRAADKVFFCVADPATVVWIRDLRPDAFDLYVLYDDAKQRNVTYMQMTEAILHHVREGQHVVCVFYGHPGVFVLATHRAVLIARREGHRAIMRPGICALDCLCADLGVDPAQPGMQTHEATDMLVRQRPPDTTLHVVLWQVGLIGEMGYRREGYINRNFSLFIEYLQQFYGDDYELTHYVASRYQTLPPVIEKYRLSELHDPVVQTRITGISTFYLAPRDIAPPDLETAKRLGLVRPGQTLTAPASPLRDIGSYRAREMRAFDAFARFSVPRGYQWQPPTEASRFLVALRHDVELQRLYTADPERALRDPRFARLTPAERRLLATRDAGSIQIAAKGLQRRESSNHALLLALLSDRSACIHLQRLRRTGGDRDAWLADYAARRALSLTPETLHTDVVSVRRQHLQAWTGVYAGDAAAPVVTLLASSAAGLLYVNDVHIPSFTFSRATLEWRAEKGNPSNGFLRFETTKRGRRIIGRIWDEQGPDPEVDYFELGEVDPDREHLAPLTNRFLRDEAPPECVFGDYSLRAGTRRIAVQWAANGLLINGAAATFEGDGTRRLAWSGGPAAAVSGSFNVLGNPLTGEPEVHGHSVDAEGTQRSCSGARVEVTSVALPTTTIPANVLRHLTALCSRPVDERPRFLWPTWEKYQLTSRVVSSLADEGGRT